MPEERVPCHDCGVEPGALHEPGCDIESCPLCGGQLISCGCDPPQLMDWERLPWTGIMYEREAMIAAYFNKYAYEGGGGRRYPCDKNHPGARPSLNAGCAWLLGHWQGSNFKKFEGSVAKR